MECKMLCLKNYEEYAEKYLNSNTWAFISQGAEKEITLQDNLDSFTRYRLIPKLLNNAFKRDLTTTVLGEKVSIPFGIAPTAYQKLAHSDGEIGAAKAAAEMNTIYTLSTVASTSLEDVAKNVPEGSLRWMQIYIMKQRELTEKMIRKAEANGYKALVLTVDTPVTGLHLRLPREQLLLPPHIGHPNITSLLGQSNVSICDPSCVAQVATSNMCDTLSWEDVAWIKSVSKLPLILKGILTVDDAQKAVNKGAAAIWVSNHGGRQLDGVKASLDALPDIATTMSGQCEVYVDGGIRWGSDVLKALALGAKFVFIGRPALWGLAHNGEKGVLRVLQILKAELDKAMHLSGCKQLKDIGPHLLSKEQASKI